MSLQQVKASELNINLQILHLLPCRSYVVLVNTASTGSASGSSLSIARSMYFVSAPVRPVGRSHVAPIT